MTRLVVEPLTRVEGHGRVELLLDNNRLEGVRVRLLESPRLFEALVVGRHYAEVPDLVCRICAICSAVHKLTALEALEQALSVEVPPLARAVRELLLLGGHVQSHALHLFCLVLPDFTGDESLVPLLRRQDPLACAGLALKAFGNRVQEVAGGRVIHPVNPVFGGVVYRPRPQELEDLLRELDDWLLNWPAHARAFDSAAHFPPTEKTVCLPVATGHPEQFSLNGALLWAGSDQQLPVADYARLFKEKAVDHSYAKCATGSDNPLLVGALARVSLATARGCVADMLPGNADIHANNLAQLNEIGWALGRMRQLIGTILDTADGAPLQVPVKEPRAGVGTAAMEAPRGLLVHHYVVDEWGQVVAADVVTPTAINQSAITAQIMSDLAGEQDPRVLKRTTERIVRSFDPCISCAVHLLEC